MKKKNGIRLTRRSKTYTKGLAYAITTYARVQMPPYYRRFAYRHKKCPDAAQSDRTRCPLVYIKIFEHRKYANSFFIIQARLPDFFRNIPNFVPG